MFYYKFKRDCYDHFTGHAFVKNELLTETERNTKARYISDELFDVFYWKATNTYMSFGVRFQVPSPMHTKQEQGFIAEYEHSTYTSVEQCYSSPSDRKLRAQSHCIECCFLVNGYGFRIISHNTWVFSCAYKYINIRTGYEHMIVHTGYNVYDFPLRTI